MPLSSDTPQHWHHRVTYTGANHTQLVEKSLSNCSDCCLHLLQSLCFSDSQEDWQKASSCTRKVLFPRWEIGAQLWSPGTSKGSVLWTLHEPRRRGSYTHPKTMRGPCTQLEAQRSAGRRRAHEKRWHWRSVHTHITCKLLAPELTSWPYKRAISTGKELHHAEAAFFFFFFCFRTRE